MDDSEGSTNQTWLREASARQDLFDKNLELLTTRFPEHTRPLQALKGIPSPSIVFLFHWDQWGQFFLLDDDSNPVAGDRAWYKNLQKGDSVTALLLGLGAGHMIPLIEEDLERYERIVVLEPDPERLGVACGHYDLRPLVESGKVLFWVPEDAYEASDWIGSLQDKEALGEWKFTLFLHPRFVQASPQFLWNLACRLAEDDDRFRSRTQFSGMPEALLGRYPAPPNWSENWAQLLRLQGLGQLRGIGRGETAVLLGPDPSPEEIGFINEHPTLPVLCNASLLPKCPVTPAVVFCTQEEGPPPGLHPETLLVASAPTFARGNCPVDSVCFWTEKGPSFRMTQPRYSTPQLLLEAGFLPTGESPLCMGLALANHLGFERLVILGPGVKQDHLPESIEIQEQARRYEGEILCLTEEVGSITGGRVFPFVPSPSRISEAVENGAGEGKGIGPDRSPPSLKQRARLAKDKKPDLPAGAHPIDRSFKGLGKTLLDEKGRLKSGDSNEILEALFAHNLLALQKSHPRVAEKVEACLAENTGSEVFQLGTNALGYPFLAIDRQGHRVVSLPLLDDPWEEVGRFRLWERILTRAGNLFLGIGLGFHLEACLERTDIRYLVWEPVIDRLVGAMHLRNLAPLFSTSRVEWLVGHSAKEVVDHYLTSRVSDTFRHPPVWLPIVEPGLRAANAPHTEAFLAEVKKREGDIRSARGGFDHILFSRSKRYFRNALRKAQAIPLGNLKDRFKGIPAIIVAAGPSLEVTAPLLNQVQDRALIFVVDTAFRYLQPRDIDRHFVVTIDPKEETSLHFKDRAPRESDVLIATSGTPEDVWDLFPGQKLVGDFPSPLLNWLGEILGHEVYPFWGGGSVAISAIGAAHEMGCTPIILTGQDLAVLPKRTHVADTIYPDKSDQEAQFKEFEVAALNGGTVMTTPPLAAILKNLEARIAMHGIEVINATAFGARIAGTRQMPFEQVLDLLPPRKVDLGVTLREVAKAPSLGRLTKSLATWEGDIEVCRKRAVSLVEKYRTLREGIRAGKMPRNPGDLAATMPRSLLEMGLQSPPLRKMEDFLYQDALRYMDYEPRVASAPDHSTRLRWDLDRTLPFLEAIVLRTGEVLGEIRDLLAKVGA